MILIWSQNRCCTDSWTWWIGNMALNFWYGRGRRWQEKIPVWIFCFVIDSGGKSILFYWNSNVEKGDRATSIIPWSFEDRVEGIEKVHSPFKILSATGCGTKSSYLWSIQIILGLKICFSMNLTTIFHSLDLMWWLWRDHLSTCRICWQIISSTVRTRTALGRARTSTRLNSLHFVFHW